MPPIDQHEKIPVYHESISAGRRLANPPPGEEVCITGLTGTFPESKNVHEFRDNLLNKVDMIVENHGRWTMVHPDLPLRMGKIHNVGKFDASFFGCHHTQAHLIDPMSRMLLEKAYEAIVDAGVNPEDLRGTRTGVFLGACSSEKEGEVVRDLTKPSMYSMIGCSRASFANRISYWLKLNGPSYTVDTACSSSLYALEHAYRAIRDGDCDQALVGGANLCLHPLITMQFSRIGVLSNDGSCKSFDAQANGYVRSESVNMVLLQKAKNAKRIYATVVHAKTNCDGYKEQGITYPAGRIQEKLLEEFYSECQVCPSSLEWVEAHGTGTEVGDPEEIKAISSVMGKGRSTSKPLLVGSVKSNMGHTEPASGLCSVTKVIIAMETGLIPPNLHFETPKPTIPSLIEGTIKVVTDPQPWDRGLVGINSFGFGGANCHVLLKGNPKKKINGGAPSDKLPRLVTVSSRTERGVQQILDDLESRPVDAELASLYHGIHNKEIPTHLYRGYILLKPGMPIRHAQYYSKCAGRPVWFVLAGCENQWGTLAKSLLTIPAFASAIEKCQIALRPIGLDLIKIVTEEESKDAIHTSVATLAVQIGLLDVLSTVGIHPDGIIGYSVGELAAGYADKCITLEQAMLASYYRGVALLNANIKIGTHSMACIEMGHEKIRTVLPQEIDIARHHSPKCCVIVGPSPAVITFITAVRAKGVVAEEIVDCDIAAHTRNVESTCPNLLKHLQKVIPSPKPRSKNWVSSSVSETQRQTIMARFGSAEYFTNNLLSPVLFEEACKQIPANATVIDLSSNGALRDILTNLRIHVVHMSQFDKQHDATEYLLTSLGRLFEIGHYLELASLYPAVEYPVSRGTPMISPMIDWDHSKEWFVDYYGAKRESKSAERYVKILITSLDHQFYRGHVVDGRNLFPATGYLFLIWETFSLMNVTPFAGSPVVFENVRFHRATNLPTDSPVDFIMSIQKATGHFEVVEGGASIVTGYIYMPDDASKEMIDIQPSETNQEEVIELSARDIYKELNLRGYNYRGVFRSVLKADHKGTRGQIKWVDNWVAFMDNMLQIQILSEDTRGLFVPTSIDKVVIDPMTHMNLIRAMDLDGVDNVFDVIVNHEANIIKAGGVEVRGLNASAITRRKQLADPVLEKYLFVPNENTKDDVKDLEEALRICVQVALENQLVKEVKCFEVADEEAIKPLLAPNMIAVLEGLPLIRPLITVLSKANNPLTANLAADIQVKDMELPNEKGWHFVLGTNILGRAEVLQSAIICIGTTGYIICRERLDQPTQCFPGLNVINDYRLKDERLMLVKKVLPIADPMVITVEEGNYNWIPTLQTAVRRNKSVQRILLVAQGEPMNGLLGMFNCIHKEPGCDFVRCFFILDPAAPAFDRDLPFYQKQIGKDVAMNVFQDGCWGTFRHLQLEERALVEARHVYATLMTRGDLSSFRWFEGHIQPDKFKLGPRQKLVDVYYTALNFRDVMAATGKLAADICAKGRLNQECIEGLEFSGRDPKGNRVMGMVSSGALSSIAVADTDLLWQVPDEWTLEEAATVPVVYGTAYYALMMGGGMKRGDSVLIHSGTGGVGQAAINISLHEGCTVFTTVGTQEKRDFIKKIFPQLTDRHIGNSRDTSFEQLVMGETNGRGVDIVLNSLAEEKLQASIRCLAVGGRFMEIGKFDLAANNTIGMGVFAKEISFHGIMLDNLFTAQKEDKAPIFNIISKGIKEGAVRPLSRTVFPDDEVEQAFRYMAAGKHIGKVLLKIRSEEEQKIVIPELLLKKALPRYFCNPEHAYIIAGGLGGFGLELADWMVLRGARKLVLTSRYGLKTGYQKSRIHTWKTYGATVHISTREIFTEEGVRALLNDAKNLGPVAGIFNLAVELHDELFENQTAEKFLNSALPKAVATKHMDMISREMCRDLKHFVTFSSVSCGRGNAGQTNYGMSNSVMERICEQRVKDGYPGLAVQWGAVGDVGLVADMQEENQEVVIGGTLQQQIASCLQVLDIFLRKPHPVVASMVVAEKKRGNTGSGSIVDVVTYILGMKDLSTVSLQLNLSELGMDSMMAVEIKQAMERDFEVFLSPKEMRGLTFAKLIELSNEVAEKSKAQPETSELYEDAFEFMIRAIGDEEAALRPITILPSLGDGNSRTSPIFMIPGIEGMTSVLEPLAKNLKSRAIGLELGYVTDHSTETTLDMAKALLTHVKANLEPKSPFYLIGYSFGGVVALDLAVLLENEGYQGEIFLVDGAPDFIQELCKSQLINGSEDNLQVNLLITILNLIKKQSSSVIESIRSAMIDLGTWDKRVELFTTLFPDTHFSPEYVKAAATSTFRRIQSILNYTWSHASKVKSKVTLLRPSYLSMQSSEDYGLSKYCENSVDVHFVEGDHVSILRSLQVANFINSQVFTLE